MVDTKSNTLKKTIGCTALFLMIIFTFGFIGQNLSFAITDNQNNPITDYAKTNGYVISPLEYQIQILEKLEQKQHDELRQVMFQRFDRNLDYVNAVKEASDNLFETQNALKKVQKQLEDIHDAAANSECLTGQILLEYLPRRTITCVDEPVALNWINLGIAEALEPITFFTLQKYGFTEIEILDDASVKNLKQEDDAQTNSQYLLNLPRSKVSVTIPMHQGYFEGDTVFFIITDASDQYHADIISENQNWSIHAASSLKDFPFSSLSPIYMFTNGVKGNGILGFQNEVFTNTPTQSELYSAFVKPIRVTWNSDSTPQVLDSEDKILSAIATGDVFLTETDLVLNMPQIVWPEGQMQVRKYNIVITNDTPFVGPQVVDINTNSMDVTFIAYRGWNADGRTIYYIMTDGVPSEITNSLGLINATSNAVLAQNSNTIEMFRFSNGVSDVSGMEGFQPAIISAAPGDDDYIPMCKILMVGWDEPEDAFVLANKVDLDYSEERGEISMDSEFEQIINCPIVEPLVII